MTDRAQKNTLGDADLGYLDESAGDLGRGYSNATPKRHRYSDATPYELALEPARDEPWMDPDWEWIDPENTDEGGFLQRPGTGFKEDIRRG
jgi:hypothetical protein